MSARPQSRAKMFHATARTLRSAADKRLDGDGDVAVLDTTEAGLPFTPAEADEAPDVSPPSFSTDIDAEALQTLHSEFRWAESKLMQASERLVEAQEARRKDLVALECMRRELRASYDAERAYTQGQVALLGSLLPKLWSREREVDEVVSRGAATAAAIRELAVVRAERKLYELASAQAHAQIARIDQDQATLDFDVANDAFASAITGTTMGDLARLRTAKTRAVRMAVRLRGEAAELIDTLGIDTTHGEVAALSSFLSAEFEGDARARERLTRVRSAQTARELAALPRPARAWQIALHPVAWAKARRIATS